MRNVILTINPREVVVVVGASGAGKTAFLRLIVGVAVNIKEERYVPISGTIKVLLNVKGTSLIPNEFKPEFGEESILENLYKKTGDEQLAVEILNKAGLFDSILYRAKLAEPSTGQKERAKLASLLAEKPNLIVIDEFTARLDALTAMRVAGKFSQLAREAGITLVLVTHKSEVIEAMEPDKVLFVGYGTIQEQLRRPR